MPTFEDLTDVEISQLREPNIVAFAAVFAAATTIGTMFIAIPVGPGVLNFGEIVIYIAAFLFGGVVGGFAGGVGAAAADVLLGFGVFAPITFVVKGLEGFVVGQLSGRSVRSKTIAVMAGAPIMIAGYFLAVAYLYGLPAAVGQELPIDIIQAGVGYIIALPISQTLQDRLPRLQESAGIESAQPPDSQEDEITGSIISGMTWMVLLSILLFWLPGLGPLIAGYVGGRKANGVANGIIAAIIPALLLGGVIFAIISSVGLPVIGALIGGAITLFVIVHSFALLVGAIIGGTLAQS